eukprot:TRINITY_DN4551_c0_g1_i1.p2 TRINITY_DN4551_c0_g1~~TRINITY_DN4551_c0_g1_i1.p2  ORF type:complete len:203 (-),score=42.21 TRINITY_DN4551_c0_g1_i1:74-682(-)
MTAFTAEDWKMKTYKDTTQSAGYRSIENFSATMCRSIMTIKRSLSAVTIAFRDGIDDRLNPSANHATIYERNTQEETLWHVQTTGSFSSSGRDSVFRRIVSEEPNRTVIMKFSVPEIPKKKGIVRNTIFLSGIILEELAENEVKVDYLSHVDNGNSSSSYWKEFHKTNLKTKAFLEGTDVKSIPISITYMSLDSRENLTNSQ